MGLEFHGRDCADPHGASVPLWSLQVSQRTDLDRWRSSLARDTGNGFYRAGSAIRPGCLLGIGHRSIDRKPGPGNRAVGCEPDARRPDHCRRDTLTLLRVARLCCPGSADCVRLRAPAHGAEVRNQRVADAGTHRSPRDVSAGISRTDPQKRSAVRAERSVEEPPVLRFHYSFGHGLRLVFRSLWAGRPALPLHYSVPPAPGFLLSVAL